MFVGKNPWMSQSFPRARVVLKEIAKDPGALDDRHRPGAHRHRQDGRLPPAGAARHRRLVPGGAGRRAGAGGPRATTRSSPSTSTASSRCASAFARRRRRATTRALRGRRGTDPRRGAAHRRRRQRRGVRGPRHPAGAEQHAVLVPEQAAVDPHRQLRATAAGSTCIRRSRRCSATARVGRTPVTGAPIIGGLVPCNVVPDEILTDHPDRFRAMIVESSNPGALARRLAALPRGVRVAGAVVVIDVAMTETARLADYVLPAASQFEKPEATFFNLEFPHNIFHLRHPLLEPLPGHAARARDLGAAGARARRRRRRRAAAAARGRARGPARLRAGVRSTASPPIPCSPGWLPFVLYETLGPTLPDGLAGAAALWGLAQKARDDLPRRGAPGGPRRRQRAVRGDPRRAAPASRSPCTSTRTTSS